MAKASMVAAIDLKRMVGSIAASYDAKGAIVITVDSEEFRLGVSNLTDREIQDALCVGIHHSLLKTGGAS